LNFRWLKNAANLADGGNIAGSMTSTLTVSDVSAADVAGYSVIVSSALGEVSSAAARLAVKLIRPTFSVAQPKKNARLLSPALQINGKARSPLGVEAVFYQLNGGGWSLAASTNNWTNWTTEVTLLPGPNLLQAYALDSVGNVSLTNLVKCFYVLKAPLAVGTSGFGTVSPHNDGRLLEVGEPYAMTAKAGKGFAFTNWTGSISTNTAKLAFVMASNLTFTANFLDVARPVSAILSPKASQKLNQGTFTIAGKARDNVGVTGVFWQLNGQGWNPASTTNQWTNWTAEATLTLGSNTVQAVAADARGNWSPTNQVKFFYLQSAP
jgi:hypothetical protein